MEVSDPASSGLEAAKHLRGFYGLKGGPWSHIHLLHGLQRNKLDCLSFGPTSEAEGGRTGFT